MAALNGRFVLAGLLLLASCSDRLVGLHDTLTPLGRIHVLVHGDLASLRPAGTEAETPRLRVALVWGQQYMAETFCWLHALPGDPSATAVAAAGCRDVAGFVPQLVGDDVDVTPEVPTTIDLLNLPTAEVMVGSVDSRVAYGSLLVYDDRDGNGTLDLHRTIRPQDQPPGKGGGPGGPKGGEPAKKVDFVYGASFVSMTLPDKRIAFREGTFDATSAFYPRAGCSEPPVGYSVLGAGGFSIADVIASVLKLENPPETACTNQSLDDGVVEIALQATETMRDVACTVVRAAGSGSATSSAGSANYREPSEKSPDLRQPWVCQSTRHAAKAGAGGLVQPPTTTPDNIEMVLAMPPSDCKQLVHYVLRGCSNDANCATPQWDLSAKPPAWWPCPIGGANTP